MILVIKHKTSNEISEIVKGLKLQGLQVGIDFDFAYSPGRYVWETQQQIPRETTFTFYNEKEGIMFALRWS